MRVVCRDAIHPARTRLPVVTPNTAAVLPLCHPEQSDSDAKDLPTCRKTRRDSSCFALPDDRRLLDAVTL
ncbi:MAG: hypothetical protein AAF471_05770 [Myxococcota bacterium]